MTSSLASAQLAFRRGLFFAGIQHAIDQDEPLDPDAIWRAWTEPRSAVFEFLASHWPPRRYRRRFLERSIAGDHGSGIEAHYDVSNDFYRLWLDREFMFYSCARFESPADSLEQAQRNKARFLLGLLDPRLGERILDLGCGWGGMLKAMSAATGDRESAVGISLSPAQVGYVQDELGLKCEYGDFIMRDYPPGAWDKVVTIGSLEHVRPMEIEPLHRKLYQALPSGGRVVHQFFSLDRDPHSTAMVALQHFFPGTVLSRHEDVLQAMRLAGFTIELDTTDDYRPTLRSWFDNLVASKEPAVRLVGPRVYNKYLVFFAASWRFFNDGNARVHRMLLRK
jgi:cyclopropane-fatty-acyl-phospholipid synthase